MSTIIKEGPLLVSLEKGVKTITFNKPTKRNAIDNDSAFLMRDVILESQYDESRVILLQGMGDHFCAGADLSPGTQEGEFSMYKFLKTSYNPMVSAMRNMDKIFIAKVRGNSVGVGCSFALACDLTYCSPDATFSQIFTHIGLSSDGGGSYFMGSKLGFKKAFELMAFHEKISGTMAEELGLVNKVIPSEELDDYVNQVVNRIAGGPFIAIKHTKSNLRAALTKGLEAALEQEAENQEVNSKTKDFMEGVSAFLQKRKANFTGE